jgi:anaerobic ribonucleoside-triphosphate reductase activating protein
MDLDETFLPIIKPKSPAEPQEQNLIQLAGFESCSYVAGPGRRCVIWVAGCHRRCPGCFQPHFFSFESGERISVEKLAARVLETSDIEGISLSGGEPFEQSWALAKFCQIIKAHSSLSILAYSGYRYENLANDESRQVLLKYLDILIDGEFRQEMAGNFRWRGSANQRIFQRPGADFPLMPEESRPVNSTQEIQINISDKGVSIMGFPDADFQKTLSQKLALRGIILKREV